jgi:hypothetical protein
MSLVATRTVEAAVPATRLRGEGGSGALVPFRNEQCFFDGSVFWRLASASRPKGTAHCQAGV